MAKIPLNLHGDIKEFTVTMVVKETYQFPGFKKGDGNTNIFTCTSDENGNQIIPVITIDSKSLANSIDSIDSDENNKKVFF